MCSLKAGCLQQTDVKIAMLMWKWTAQLGTGVTAETTSLWSQTRAASQGPWTYLSRPSLAAISNHGHNFGQWLVARLAQGQPREEWGWASTSCSCPVCSCQAGPPVLGYQCKGTGLKQDFRAKGM